MSSDESSPTKRTFELGPQERADRQEGVRRRAPEVVDRRPVRGKVRSQLAEHALHLAVERHRAVEHVVEDRGGVLAEGEVVVADAASARTACPGRTWRSIVLLGRIERFPCAAVSDDVRQHGCRRRRSPERTGAPSGNSTSPSTVTTPQLAKCTASGSRSVQNTPLSCRTRSRTAARNRGLSGGGASIADRRRSSVRCFSAKAAHVAQPDTCASTSACTSAGLVAMNDSRISSCAR